MIKLSTGDDSTLENYRKLCVEIFGENSRATLFIDDQISKSPNGAKEEVTSDEALMVNLLISLAFGK